jgi:predicted TIM-barrel fold metal-dependent hydrolase
MGIYPDKIIGEAVINPNYPSEVQNELERCFSNGFKIFKLHPKVHNYRPDGINYKPVYEFCNDNKLVILSHTFGSPDFLEDMAKTYKNVTYIIGHGHEKGYEGLLRRYENVFQCISDSNEFGDIERLTKEGGSDKLLFGTDALYFDPGFALGVLVYADISDDDKRKILGKNMLEILKDKKIIRSP